MLNANLSTVFCELKREFILHKRRTRGAWTYTRGFVFHGGQSKARFSFIA